MFADDSNLFVSGKNLDSLQHQVITALGDISRWLAANRLSLNVKKTNFMLFTSMKKSLRPNLNINIMGEEIHEVEHTKFLGIILDNHLNWKEHIKYLTSKMAKSVGIFAKTRKYFNKAVLTTLYYSFLYPYLLYGNIIWGGANATTLHPIYRIQKIVIRLMCNLKRRTSLSPHFKIEKILKVKDIHNYLITIFMFKYTEGSLPRIFDSFFQINQSIHLHHTRQSSHFHCPIYKSRAGNEFLKKSGVNIWNNIVLNSRNIYKIGVLKTLTREEILEMY